MVQPRQDSPLLGELFRGRGGEQSAADKLDRHRLIESAVDPLAPIHRPHAASADQLNRPIGADPLRRRDVEAGQ